MILNSNLKIKDISNYERIFISINSPRNISNTDYISGYSTSNKMYFLRYQDGKQFGHKYIAKVLPYKYKALYKIPDSYPDNIDIYINEIKIKGKIKHKIVNINNKTREFNKKLGNVFIEDYLDEFSKYIFTSKYVNMYLDNLDYIPKYYFRFIKSHSVLFMEVLSLDDIKELMIIRPQKNILDNTVYLNNKWNSRLNIKDGKCPICNNRLITNKYYPIVSYCFSSECLFPFSVTLNNFDLELPQQVIVDNNIDNFDKLFNIDKNLVSKDSYKKIISLKNMGIRSFTKKHYIYGSKGVLLAKNNNEILKYYEELVRLKDLLTKNSVVNYYIDSVFNIKLTTDSIRYYLYTLKYIDVLEYFIPKWKIN